MPKNREHLFYKRAWCRQKKPTAAPLLTYLLPHRNLAFEIPFSTVFLRSWHHSPLSYLALDVFVFPLWVYHSCLLNVHHITNFSPGFVPGSERSFSTPELPQWEEHLTQETGHLQDPLSRFIRSCMWCTPAGSLAWQRKGGVGTVLAPTVKGNSPQPGRYIC